MTAIHTKPAARLAPVLLALLMLALLVVGGAGAHNITINSVTERYAYNITNQSLSSLRLAPGSAAVLNQTTSYALLQSNATSDTYRKIIRSVLTFNTSDAYTGIPANATNITVSIVVRGTATYTNLGSPTLSLINATPVYNLTADASDYNRTGFVRLASDIPLASYVTGGDNTFTLFGAHRTFPVPAIPVSCLRLHGMLTIPHQPGTRTINQVSSFQGAAPRQRMLPGW